MTETVRGLLSKAAESIGAANVLLADGYFDFAASRAYERELFIGYAVRAGRLLGVPMPLHDELYTALSRKG